MELAVNRGTVLRVGFGVILSISYFTLGCSSDSSSPAKTDGGKKDGGKGGSGGSSSGSGGSSANGGTSGSGGSSARGGSSGSGGSSNSGGSSASGGSGGSAGAGGSSASGGSSGSGGSSKSGGSSGSGGAGGVGTGGAQLDGGGSGDVQTSDAQDAPLPGDDGAASEAGASNDAPVLLDTAAQDSERIDSATIDTTVVILDAELDTKVLDAPAQDLGLDSSADAGTCLHQIVGNGYAFTPAAPCSQCQDITQNPPTDLHTQCQGMVDCMEAASCENPADNCFVICRNTVGGNQVATGNCVAALVAAACHE